MYENADLRIEGKIIGFDEYMNTVLDEAEEVNLKKGGARKKIGRIILKGDNISLICNIRYALFIYCCGITEVIYFLFFLMIINRSKCSE